MESLQLELPAMYGDHHVLAVRQILLGMDGVADVWASAAWRTVQVEYDPDKLPADQIQARLTEEGYTQPVETPVLRSDDVRARRFTTAMAEAGKQISFAQKLPLATGRPLYPCPGMSPWRAEPDETLVEV
ncbi:MAG: heavy-metal-associated domain-containing protein [Anaerolineae bacterium]|nr:heavy-metal-associated domain-containing protein [Anaerolineae bacterium]